MSKPIDMPKRSYRSLREEPKEKELVLVPENGIEALDFLYGKTFFRLDDPAEHSKSWIGINNLKDRSALAIINDRWAIVAHFDHVVESSAKILLGEIKRVLIEKYMFSSNQSMHAFLIHPRELKARCEAMALDATPSMVQEVTYFQLQCLLHEMSTAGILEMSSYCTDPNSTPKMDRNVFEIHRNPDGVISIYMEGSKIYSHIPSPNATPAASTTRV